MWPDVDRFIVEKEATEKQKQWDYNLVDIQAISQYIIT